MSSRNRPRYESPPLVEAVVEFQFHQNPNWDVTFLGQMRDRLTQYPALETLRGTSFIVDAEQIGFRPAPEGKRFWSEDRSVAITVAPDVLGVSILPPKMPDAREHCWERLQNLAFDTLQTYQKVTSPAPIRQASVRYINVVTVIPGNFRLRDYVSESSGVVAAALLDEQNPFSSRIEHVTKVAETHQVREAITLAAQGISETQGHLILDLDEVSLWQSPPELDGLRIVSDEMHDAVHDVFNRVFRPEVLETFGPIKS